MSISSERSVDESLFGKTLSNSSFTKRPQESFTLTMFPSYDCRNFSVREKCNIYLPTKSTKNGNETIQQWINLWELDVYLNFGTRSWV